MLEMRFLFLTFFSLLLEGPGLQWKGKLIVKLPVAGFCPSTNKSKNTQPPPSPLTHLPSDPVHKMESAVRTMGAPTACGLFIPHVNSSQQEKPCAQWLSKPLGKALLEAGRTASRIVPPWSLPTSCGHTGTRRNHQGSVWARGHRTWQTCLTPAPGRSQCALSRTPCPHSRGFPEQSTPQQCMSNLILVPRKC